MYTSEGRYFTGQKTYWYACPEKSGHVLDIEASVKAWDNEGRAFQGPVVKLTEDQVKRATSNVGGYKDVLDEMIRDLYETHCAVEELLKVKVEADEEPRQESAPGQDPGHVQDATEQGPGDPVANGQISF